MRFGIMAMQLEALVPPGVPAEQIMASIMSFDHAGLAKSLSAKGFNPIELGGDLGMFLPHAYSPESIEKLAGLKARRPDLHPAPAALVGGTFHPSDAGPQGLGGGGGADRSRRPARSNRKSTCCMPPARWRPNSTT